jgi:hypothetical protein
MKRLSLFLIILTFSSAFGHSCPGQIIFHQNKSNLAKYYSEQKNIQIFNIQNIFALKGKVVCIYIYCIKC